jgi:hypothetical protein
VILFESQLDESSANGSLTRSRKRRASGLHSLVSVRRGRGAGAGATDGRNGGGRRRRTTVVICI